MEVGGGRKASQSQAEKPDRSDAGAACANAIGPAQSDAATPALQDENDRLLSGACSAAAVAPYISTLAGSLGGSSGSIVRTAVEGVAQVVGDVGRRLEHEDDVILRSETV